MHSFYGAIMNILREQFQQIPVALLLTIPYFIKCQTDA